MITKMKGCICVFKVIGNYLKLANRRAKHLVGLYAIRFHLYTHFRKSLTPISIVGLKQPKNTLNIVSLSGLA